MKHKNKTIVMVASILGIVSLLAVALGKNASYSLGAADGDYGNHYLEKSPTCTDPGVKEYWISCVNSQIYFDEPATGNWEDKGVATVVIDDPSDPRYLAPTHNIEHVDVLDSTENHAGNLEHYHCLACDKLFSDAAGNNEITSESVTLAQKAEGFRYSFLLNESNAPEGSLSVNKDIECTSKPSGDTVAFHYVGASVEAGKHIALSDGGYIANDEAIKGITSLTVEGNGDFKLSYGFEGYTHYENFSLASSSKAFALTETNFFKVESIDGGSITSISGQYVGDKGAMGTRPYSTVGGTDPTKWTRLIHDIDATSNFELNVSWHQIAVDTSNNANNPRIQVFDAAEAYDANDEFIQASNKPSFLVIQYRQDWCTQIAKAGWTSSKGPGGTGDINTPSNTAGVDGYLVDSSGHYGTTYMCNLDGTKNATWPGGSWKAFFDGADISARINMSGRRVEIHWTFEKVVDDKLETRILYQFADVKTSTNRIGIAIGSAKCQWSLTSSSSTGLH